MPSCTVCGGSEFTPHDGFFYCVECQTQSQDLRQIECSFRANASFQAVKSSKQKKAKAKKVKSNRLGEGPPWTTWQAFNYILKGMSDELIALGGPENFEMVVLQLWASYLQTHEIAFISRFRDVGPKLSRPFRYRDGKVLYDVDTASSYSRRSEKIKTKKKRNRSISASSSNITNIKKRMHKSDYESQLSSAVQSSLSNDINTTLESLGETDGTSDDGPRLKIPRRIHLSKNGRSKRKETDRRSKPRSQSNSHMMGKTKILALLHLALIVTRSPIQLSDLFRFIREGHLSYSVMSHFLPVDVKFGEGETIFINSPNDIDLPTHLSSRKMVGMLSSKLKFRSLPVPDLTQLLRRYVTDLLLPDGMADLAAILLIASKPPSSVKPTRQLQPLESFELIALAPLLVLFKLLLGMDGVSEYNSSYFAALVNRFQSNTRSQLFSFCDWQRAIECRRAVLCTWHFPTREQVNPSAVFDTKTAARFLSNLHRDPNLRNRLFNRRYKAGSAFDSAIEAEVEKVLENLRGRSCGSSESVPTFSPSLVPGVSLLQDLVTWLRATGKPDPPWMDILGQDWPSADVRYLVDADPYFALLNQSGVIIHQTSPDWLSIHMSRVTWIHDKLETLTDEQQLKKFTAILSADKSFTKNRQRQEEPCTFQRPPNGVLVKRCDHKYWRLTPSPLDDTIWTIKGFQQDIMPLFPTSWSWLLTQCSNMLHISPRDIYLQVLKVEEELICQIKR